MSDSIESGNGRWYKQPFVWLVIFFPAATVVAGFITLGIAIRTDDGVVVDDYYKKGKEINRVITRDRQAASMGLSGNSAYNPENRRISITLASSQGAVIPGKIRLELLHATRGGIDIDSWLAATRTGHYETILKEALAPGGWIVQISTADWRIQGRITVPGQYSSPLSPP